jgi:hypothetical protein
MKRAALAAALLAFTLCANSRAQKPCTRSKAVEE